MTRLIVNLPRTLPAPATPCEALLSDDGRTVLRTVEAPALLLPAPAGVEIIAVVPVSRLSWHRLALPRGALKANLFQEGNAGRLRSILDGLLEDRVLDDTSQLHFAIEPRARDGEPVWVAACDRAWLHGWLAALEQAGRPVSRIVPELAPPTTGALDAASLHVIGTPENAQLLLAGDDGVTLLPLSAATVQLVAWPDDAALLAEPGVAALAEHYFKRAVTPRTAAERWLAAAQPGWDLAQFDLLYNRGTRTRKRLSALAAALLRAPRWRAARWAVVALVASNLIGLQAWAWKEQSAQADQGNAIRGTLTATFPEVRVVVDAPLQMARALADLQRRNGAAAASDMETMLSQYQAVTQDGRAPSAIEFVAGELRLKGLDAVAGGLNAMSARLRANGYSARQDGDTLVLKEERFP